MSDHWEMFPCTLGENTAWIAYDHGIGEEIGELPFLNAVRFKVPLQAPDDRGLPQGDEFARLNEIADELTKHIAALGGCYVGRITTNGARYFFFYSAADEAQCGTVAASVRSKSGYQILLAHEADPERNAYWTELYPTEDDWQVMKDLRIEEVLRKNGDLLDQPRAIKHWAYFQTAADRARFLSLVGGKFDSFTEFEAPEADEGRFGAALSHVGLPDYHSMNSFTLALARGARECDGIYDGWEAEVCKP